ncbi:MAG: MFS transporter [Sporichthyaceae bacterium]
MATTSTHSAIGAPAPDARRQYLVLATLCAATVTIMLATSTMNVALPSLVVDMSASTRDLQWIVDGYNLAFAALVLAFGSLSDRYGRKGALLLGLAVFGGAALAGSQAANPGQLTAAQVVMGLGAAAIFPTTLSIISNVFVDRIARAKAIGIWGAAAGMGSGFGPAVGGALTETWSWRANLIFLTLAAVAVAVASAQIVQTSRDPGTPRVDVVGLLISVAAVGGLVFTIIEAPHAGWDSVATFGGFAVAAAMFAALVAWELRCPHPMLDVRLFLNPRFSAASGSLAFLYFALFGFIFLATQYMQFLLGYSPLETGLRIAPVAVALGVGSVVGTALAMRIGNKIVVTVGLAMFGLCFAWISTDGADLPYWLMLLQLIPMGIGAGFASAPATEAVMGAVSKEKAGIGSAMNDATREFGGTLGVAVIGSVQVSLYSAHLVDGGGLAALPEPARAVAEDSLGAAQQVIAGVGDPALAAAMLESASDAFLNGFAAACLVAAAVCFAGALITGLFLPARPDAELDAEELAVRPTPAEVLVARLRGRVRNPAGTPVGNALVTVHAADGTVLASCRSGADGHFALAELPAGSHRIDVVQSLIAEQTVHLSGGVQNEVDLVLGRPVEVAVEPVYV